MSKNNILHFSNDYGQNKSLEAFTKQLGYASELELINATKSVNTFIGSDGQIWVAPIPEESTVKELTLIDETRKKFE
jgi:hypothetical protein